MIPTIDHFVGQEQVKKLFRVALEASWNDGTRLPHMLMTGGPGLGKTSLAQIAAREMGATLHERIGQVLNNPVAVNGLLAQAGDKDLVFIDEIHEMPPEAQTLLYRAVEDRKVFVTTRDRKTMALPVNDFTLLLATTDAYSVLPPLRDRCKLILQFHLYEEQHLTTIVQQRAQMLSISLDADVAPEIAKRGRGTPRIAIRLLESCHRYARSLGDSQVTMGHFLTTVELEQVDALGLDTDQQQYLRILASHRGEYVRLHSLESVLSVHRRTIQTVIEPFLLRLELIDRASQGRQITERGLQHLGLLASDTEVMGD